MTKTISNTDDVIDSRDVIARIKELREDREGLSDALDGWATNEELEELELALVAGEEVDQERLEELREEHQKLEEELSEWDDENGEELKELCALAEWGENTAEDWEHGATLIRDSYFTEYAQELVKDIGDLPKEIPHYIVIDWEATARNIRQDYSSIEFGDETYWVR